MKRSRLILAVGFVACSALACGPAICFGQRVSVPTNVEIGEKPYGGDATDNPVIDTRRKLVQENSRTVHTFDGLGIELSSNFDGGRMSRAKLSGDGVLVLYIDSENYPINDSPWYSFRIRQLETGAPKTIQIRLAYPMDTQGDGHKGTHRYRPKLSRDGGKTWVSISSRQYDHQKAELTVTLGDRPLHVSAQELETSQRSRNWTERLAQKPSVSVEVLGRTPLGKQIRLLNIVEGESTDKYEVFIICRQHPPEVTGTLAMRRFVEYLAGNTAHATKFRSRFNVRVIPMVNPDGVDRGHWRHNMGGVDLNRDWSESTKHGRMPLFNQPETQIVAAALKKYEGAKVAFAIDFHSTHRDVFYLLTDAYRDLDNDVALNWIFRFARSIPARKFAVHKVADRVYYSTSLSWINRRFDCPVAVYEVGDETPRDELVVVAECAAKALIEELDFSRSDAKR